MKKYFATGHLQAKMFWFWIEAWPYVYFSALHAIVNTAEYTESSTSCDYRMNDNFFSSYTLRIESHSYGI